MPTPVPAPPAPPNPGPTTTTSGDPHIVTFDGLGYDLQSVGEFQLARSEALDLDVQARFTRVSDSASVSSAGQTRSIPGASRYLDSKS